MHINKYYFSIIISFFIISCSVPKKVVYFQDSFDNENIISSNSFSLKYKIGDVLEIFVSAPDIETVLPFNKSQQSNGKLSSENNLGSTYVVNNNGNIEFPVLGKIKVLGLNQLEVQELIQKSLKTYVNSTSVSVMLRNFKITVLGEVQAPGVYQISDERITITEAIGLAKDLNIRGKRENITVIRESEKGKVYHKIDITSKNIFDSPVYYLKQNDVIYVEPNKAKIQSSKNNNWTRILAAVSSVLSIALSVVALSR